MNFKLSQESLDWFIIRAICDHLFHEKKALRILIKSRMDPNDLATFIDFFS